MANVDGETPDFDEINLSDDDSSETEPLGELVVSDDETPEPEEAKPADKSEEKGGLLKALGSASPYTVMLGLAVAAILTAILFLLLELRAYDFDVKAEGARQPATAAPAVQFGPAITAAADWPIGVQLTSSAGAADEVSGSSRMT